MQHALDVPRAGCAGGGKGAGGWAGAAAQHGGDTTAQGFFNLLGCDEMDVRVDGTCRHDHAFTGNDFRAGADDDVHARLRIRITGFANRGDA